MTENSSSIEERLAYKKLIGSSIENMSSAKALFLNYKHIKWHTIKEFWDNLYQLIEEEPDFSIIKSFDNKNITDLTHFEKYRKGQKAKQKCSISFRTINGIILSIRYSAPYSHFYFGIEDSGNKQLIENLLTNYQEYKLIKWLPLAKTFSKDIAFNNFNSDLTFS